MATSLVKCVGGYDCEFIDPVPDDFICKVCNCVAREPNLTLCCGQHYCQSCIMKIVEDGKPCPNPECGEATFSAVLNKNCKRKILALRVCCTMKECGCHWTGKVEELDTHMDVNSGDCQYVEIECPEKCGQQVQKHQLASHIANECPKREFTCMHCGFKATYEVVSEKHWPECQNYPVPCPNRCQIGAVERNTLEDHLNMCSLQVVDCDFSYAGCNEKLQRQDMEKHVEENTQKHLALMAAASMKLSQEFEKKLQEQRDEFRGYLEQKIKHIQDSLQEQLLGKEQQIEALKEQIVQVKKFHEERIKVVEERRDNQIKSLEAQSQKQLERIGNLQGELHEKQQQIEALKEQILQGKQNHNDQIKAVEQRREKQIKSLEAQLKQEHEVVKSLEAQLKQEQEIEWLNMKLGMPPFTFTMHNFNQLKTRGSYCCTYWYSPCMYTHTHGYKFCIKVWPNSQPFVSVELFLMSGEFDATLQWPAEFTITLQLLNQYRNQDHIEQKIQSSPEWRAPRIFTITNTLIAHTDLKENVEKQTQYLKDSCLRFRIEVNT